MQKVLATGLSILLLCASTGYAQNNDAPKKQGKDKPVDVDAEFEKMKAQTEMVLSQILVWDEKKNKFTVRPELEKRLPVPPAFVENLLNSIVSNENGVPKITNDERFKQLLPMLQRFMKQGQKQTKGLEKQLDKLRGMSPDKQRKALKKMTERLMPEGRKESEEEEDLVRPAPPSRPLAPPKSDLRSRMDMLERQLKMLEGQLRQRFKMPGELPEMDEALQKMKMFQMQAKMWSEMMKQSLKEKFGSDWKNEMKKSFPQLGELPELPPVDLNDLRRQLPKALNPDGPAVGTMRDVSRGLKKLNEMMSPEDWMRVQRLAQTLSSTIKPEDLSNQAEIMRKLQGALNPGDLERFLELLSDFVETEEGQAMESRLEQGIQSFEEFMASDRGRAMMEALKELGKQFQNNDRKSLEKFERFFGEEEKAKADRSRDVAEDKTGQYRGRNPKARLY